MYASKFGVPKEKMMQKLWGDNYFDPSTKKWTEKALIRSRFRALRSHGRRRRCT